MNPASFLSLLPSWILLLVIALITIYFVACLLPRSKLVLKGKYVLITGCDSGFGRQTAITLDKVGVCVLATCLTKEGEQSLKLVTSDKLKTFLLDVTNSQQIKDVYSEVKKEISSGTLHKPYLSALCTLSRNKNIGTQGVQELYLLELTKKA